jgi:hypothetical protein
MPQGGGGGGGGEVPDILFVDLGPVANQDHHTIRETTLCCDHQWCDPLWPTGEVGFSMVL